MKIADKYQGEIPFKQTPESQWEAQSVPPAWVMDEDRQEGQGQNSRKEGGMRAPCRRRERAAAAMPTNSTSGRPVAEATPWPPYGLSHHLNTKHSAAASFHFHICQHVFNPRLPPSARHETCFFKKEPLCCNSPEPRAVLGTHWVLMCVKWVNDFHLPRHNLLISLGIHIVHALCNHGQIYIKWRHGKGSLCEWQCQQGPLQEGAYNWMGGEHSYNSIDQATQHGLLAELNDILKYIYRRKPSQIGGPTRRKTM